MPPADALAHFNCRWMTRAATAGRAPRWAAAPLLAVLQMWRWMTWTRSCAWLCSCPCRWGAGRGGGAREQAARSQCPLFYVQRDALPRLRAAAVRWPPHRLLPPTMPLPAPTAPHPYRLPPCVGHGFSLRMATASALCAGGPKGATGFFGCIGGVRAAQW